MDVSPLPITINILYGTPNEYPEKEPVESVKSTYDKVGYTAIVSK